MLLYSTEESKTRAAYQFSGAINNLARVPDFLKLICKTCDVMAGRFILGRGFMPTGVVNKVCLIPRTEDDYQTIASIYHDALELIYPVRPTYLTPDQKAVYEEYRPQTSQFAGSENFLDIDDLTKFSRAIASMFSSLAEEHLAAYQKATQNSPEKPNYGTYFERRTFPAHSFNPFQPTASDHSIYLMRRSEFFEMMNPKYTKIYKLKPFSNKRGQGIRVSCTKRPYKRNGPLFKR